MEVRSGGYNNIVYLQRSASFSYFGFFNFFFFFLSFFFKKYIVILLLFEMFQEGPTGASTVAQEGYVCT